MSLERLVRPLSPRNFADRYFEEAAWLATDRDDVPIPIQLGDFDRLVAVGLADRSFAILPPGTAERPPSDAKPDAPPRTLPGHLAQGSAIGIRSLERRWPSAGRLANRVMRELGHPVTIELWLLPPEFELPAPSAPQNHFVLPIAGTSSVPLDARFDRLDAEGGVASASSNDAELAPGSTLYVPSALAPALTVRAGSDACAHVEIRVEAFTYKDLLRAAMRQRVEQSPALRRSLATEALSADWGKQSDASLSAAREALDTLDFASARMQLIQQMAQRLAPLPGGQFPALEKVSEVGLETAFHLREGALPYLVQGAGQVSLRFGTGEQLAPGHPAVVAGLQFMLQTRRFRASDLPDGLSDNSKLVLCRHLVNKGFLGFDPADSTTPDTTKAAEAQVEGAPT